MRIFFIDLCHQMLHGSFDINFLLLSYTHHWGTWFKHTNTLKVLDVLDACRQIIRVKTTYGDFIVKNYPYCVTQRRRQDLLST